MLTNFLGLSLERVHVACNGLCNTLMMTNRLMLVWKEVEGGDRWVLLLTKGFFHQGIMKCKCMHTNACM